MKKITTILLISIFSLFLLACDNKEYNLIEITSEEFLNYLENNENINIVFATVNEKHEKNKEFTENIKKLSKRTKEDIYYLDYNHIELSDELLLSEYIGVDYSLLAYHVIQNNSFVVSEEYKNYETTYKDLNGKNYETSIPYTSEEDLINYIEEAKKLYQEGNIPASLEKLNKAWKHEEAKYFYKNNNYYNLINNWKTYKLLDDEGNAIYTSIIILRGEKNILYYYSNIVKMGEIEQPALKDYTKYNYILKDNQLHLTKEDNEKEKVVYNILYIDKENLTLESETEKLNLYPVN